MLKLQSGKNDYIGLVMCSGWKIPLERNKLCCGFLMKKTNDGQLHITWRDTVWRDIEPMNTAWENVCLKTVDREE